MAYYGDDNSNTSFAAANVNTDNLEQRESQPPERPNVIDVGEASSDSTRRGWRRSSHTQVMEEGVHHIPRVEGTDRRHHRYTYIPSTSSFSRERSPPPPPIIIQQPPHRYSYTPYHNTPIIIQSQPIHGAHNPSYYQPQQPYDASHGGYTQPIPAVWPRDTFGYPVHSSSGSVLQEGGSTYIAVDPFRPPSRRTSILSSSLPVAQGHEQHPNSSTPHYVVYPYTRRRTVCLALLIDFFAMLFTFLFGTLPRQIYLNFLLRLPAFYFSRVARVFEEAEMTMPEIEEMALQGMDPIGLQQLPWSSPSAANLKATWEGFIDSLLREWKTLNIISVLLLSAILTILQIESAAKDPVTRNAALFSLICALMSLLYGCMYIIRFSSMRKAYKALEWAQEGQKTKTLIWWNVWVLLAMPATWLAWSIILYIACIMSFVWRADTAGLDPSPDLSPHAELCIRIAISVVLGLGVLYFALILNTLRLYGDSMDKNFKVELERLVREKKEERRYAHGSYHRPPNDYSHSGSPPNLYTDPTTYPTPLFEPPPGARFRRYDDSLLGAPSTSSFFKPVKVMDLLFHQRGGYPMPDFLVNLDFKHEDWERFISEESLAWDGDTPLFQSRTFGTASETVMRPQDSAARVLAKWNQKYFNRRKTMGLLCHEYMDRWPHSPAFAIYLVDISSPDGQPPIIADRFGSVPEGLTRIDIFDQPGREQSRRRILGRTSIFSTNNPVDGRVHFDGQVHQHSPEVGFRSSRSSSRSGSPPRASEPRPSGRRHSRRSERSYTSRGSRSRSHSPSWEAPYRRPSYQVPPTPYYHYPTTIPPATVIVVDRSSSSSSPSRPIRLPPPRHTGGEAHAIAAEAPTRPPTKSRTDALRPWNPTTSDESPITPRTNSRRNTSRLQSSVSDESDPDLLVFPPPTSLSGRRSPPVHVNDGEPPPSPRHESIIAHDEDKRGQHTDTGRDVLHPVQKSRRSAPKSNPDPSELFIPTPFIVPQPVPTASAQSATQLHVKTPRPRPAAHEAPAQLHHSPSSQSFKSFSRSRSRSRSSSRSTPPAGQPPSARFDYRRHDRKTRLGVQRQEQARDVEDQPAHGIVHGHGRSRESRSRNRVLEPQQPRAAQVTGSSSTHKQPQAQDAPDNTPRPEFPPRNLTTEPTSSPTHGPPSAPGSGGVDDGPWTRDRSSLRTILAPSLEGGLGGAYTF